MAFQVSILLQFTVDIDQKCYLLKVTKYILVRNFPQIIDKGSSFKLWLRLFCLYRSIASSFSIQYLNFELFRCQLFAIMSLQFSGWFWTVRLYCHAIRVRTVGQAYG